MGYFRIGISKGSKKFQATPTEQDFALLRGSFEISDEQSLPFYTGGNSPPPSLTTETDSYSFHSFSARFKVYSINVLSR